MRSTRWISVAAVAAALGLWVLAAQGQHHGETSVPSGHHAAATTQPADAAHVNAAVSTHLAEAAKALAELDKAVQAGDKDATTARIKDVREHLRQARLLTAGFANTRCPIMNSAFSADAGSELTREWKGQKIGFCCGGCPEAWDKLSDQEKQAKLDAAK